MIIVGAICCYGQLFERLAVVELLGDVEVYIEAFGIHAYDLSHLFVMTS